MNDCFHKLFIIQRMDAEKLNAFLNTIGIAYRNRRVISNKKIEVLYLPWVLFSKNSYSIDRPTRILHTVECFSWISSMISTIFGSSIREWAESIRISRLNCIRILMLSTVRKIILLRRDLKGSEWVFIRNRCANCFCCYVNLEAKFTLCIQFVVNFHALFCCSPSVKDFSWVDTSNLRRFDVVFFSLSPVFKCCAHMCYLHNQITSL